MNGSVAVTVSTIQVLGSPYNFTIDQGDSINNIIAVTGMSLSGFTVTGMMERTTGDLATADFAMTIQSGNQSVAWVLSSAQSAQLAPGRYRYQIVAESSGQQTTLLWGFIEIVGAIAEGD